jgi:hypothetical protein
MAFGLLVFIVWLPFYAAYAYGGYGIDFSIIPSLYFSLSLSLSLGVYQNHINDEALRFTISLVYKNRHTLTCHYISIDCFSCRSRQYALILQFF